LNDGAPGRIRTSDPLVRSQMLYPTELRAHIAGMQSFKDNGVCPLEQAAEAFSQRRSRPRQDLIGSKISSRRMTDLPEHLFANPAWHALQTKHRHFAVSAGDACRYPADVAPFAAVAPPSTLALHQLHSLLTPGESVWLIGESYPHTSPLSFEKTLGCLQMVLPDEVPPSSPTVEVVSLSSVNDQKRSGNSKE
jgi:hypothetical protein